MKRTCSRQATHSLMASAATIALGMTAPSLEAAIHDWYGYDLRSTEWTPASAGTFTLDACALASEGDARLLARRAARSTDEAAASNLSLIHI